ncbi:TonB-dependent receptor [Parabacteroides gordonii]|uniref:TonB-dependent receptor plug domain-containing protein n=1 Tax=Parabacteroides gordonii MS-1 = DSM 23371 TaxID=1203610 RepID=A0A0F5ILV1_9BACT|nr:Plug domain-containing protein [Parabacteroides gordonii]KKB46072.1 hypothetical protein HMPREF1536_05306 [Parabacteroides gordonii MS-1 = DSM 23371]MCA5586364.1 Plug domain-containing protein [Parabacteroides gordonii]RGP18561.1 Plug domain-containing protein [Parabacteroides gordonii]
MKYYFTFLLMFFCFQLDAQRIELSNERIFLFTNKPACKQGDTIQVYGQLLASDRQYTRYSNYVYVELYNKKDSVLLRLKTKCKANGSFSVPFQVDYDWANSVYSLRAYTRLMQNFNPESFPQIELPVGMELFIPEENVPGVKCFFFPEGGQWVNGEIQNMTVYLTDSHGLSLETPFYILNHTDTVINTISLASGLQTIRLLPKDGDNFVLHVAYQGEKFMFPLPERKLGHTLQSVMNRNKISYKVISDGERITKERLFIFRPVNGLEEITLTEQQNMGILNLPPEETGLFILFLIDESANIIAQTVHWKNNKCLSIVLEKKEYLPSEILNLQVDLSMDSVLLYHRIVKRRQIAKPAILQTDLESELFSPIPFPKNYLIKNPGEVTQDVEAWLRSTRFIRFYPANIVDKDFHYRYQPETVNLFTGKITYKNGKPLKGGSIVAYNSVTNKVDGGEVASDGRYIIPVSDFEDGDYFFLQAHPVKGTAGFYEYIPDNDTFPSIVSHLQSYYSDRKYAEVGVSYQDSSGFIYQVDEFGNRGFIMPEITVKARIKQDKFVSTEKFYNVSYFDEEEMDKRNYVKIEDIFADIPGVSFFWSTVIDELGKEKQIPRLISLRGMSTLSGGDLIVLLDGQRIPLEEVIHMLPPRDIASVELLKPWQTNALTYGAIHGALVIKTREGVRSVDISSKGFYYYPLGLIQGKGYSNTAIQAPSTSGLYDLLIDMVTLEGMVYSYRFPFTVH